MYICALWYFHQFFIFYLFYFIFFIQDSFSKFNIINFYIFQIFSHVSFQLSSVHCQYCLLITLHSHYGPSLICLSLQSFERAYVTIFLLQSKLCRGKRIYYQILSSYFHFQLFTIVLSFTIAAILNLQRQERYFFLFLDFNLSLILVLRSCLAYLPPHDNVQVQDVII